MIRVRLFATAAGVLAFSATCWWAAAQKNPSMSQVTSVTQGLSDLGRSVVAGGLSKTSEAIRRKT